MQIAVACGQEYTKEVISGDTLPMPLISLATGTRWQREGDQTGNRRTARELHSQMRPGWTRAAEPRVREKKNQARTVCTCTHPPKTANSELSSNQSNTLLPCCSTIHDPLLHSAHSEEETCVPLHLRVN